MLIEFRVKNFRSIAAEQVLSLVKDTGNELEATNTVELPETKLKLLRSAAIYGPNAAGKSNIVRALSTLGWLVRKSASLGPEKPLPATPFLLDAAFQAEPSEFEITFIATDGVRYRYGLGLTKSHVVWETLESFPKQKRRRLFERRRNADSEKYKWHISDDVEGQRAVWQQATRPNALFLSTAVQLNSETLRPVYDWFSDKLRILHGKHLPAGFTIEACENPDKKGGIIGFLQRADFLIQDIAIEKKKFSAELLPADMPAAMREQYSLEMQDHEVSEVKTIHRAKGGDGFVSFPMYEESDGTQQIFDLAGPWQHALENDYVLVVDELEYSLHPHLFEWLVQHFHRQEPGRKAQLIFTTHNTAILTQEVFRRDQIWFTERQMDASTRLFPLTEFYVRKKNENIQRNYLSGRYGALPILAGWPVEGLKH